MRMPSKQRVLDYANGQRAQADQRGATDTVRHIDKLISNINRGMSFTWEADSGVLIVRSCNHQGAIYRVSEQSCDCPAYITFCTHMRLRAMIVALAGPPIDIPSEPAPTPGGDGPPVYPAPNGRARVIALRMVRPLRDRLTIARAHLALP